MKQISLMEIFGPLPLLLGIAAVVSGIVALIWRKQTLNTAVTYGLAGIACAGIGVTAWRLYSFNRFYLLSPGMVPDLTLWLGDFSTAWAAAGIILPATAVGLALVGISTFFVQRRN